MGHVDHGKTTLLDNLRNSHIVQDEYGGITQHIGAFVVPFKNELVTFLDTPGHAAFANMRKRGANVTDIVILVIACEDGVLDQTIESIKYAKECEVPIIVCVNKIDKFNSVDELNKAIANIRQQLFTNDILLEEDGGDVQLVKISALQGLGIDYLKESILALAETLELKADPEAPIEGRVIESSVDSHLGKIATILVQNGTVKKGSYLISGMRNWARVRALFDERGKLKQSCPPGQPIQVTGWREVILPSAGDLIKEAKSEKEAKKIVKQFYDEEAQKKAIRDNEEAQKKEESHRILYKEKLVEKQASTYKYRRIFFNERGKRPKETDENDELAERKVNLILKCDVDGSLEALLDLLDTYDPNNNQLVKMDVMHFGVGDITENDLVLASSFNNSVIYGFNVKAADQKLLPRARHERVQIRLFNVIYHLIDDLKAKLQDRIPEMDKEIFAGQASVMEEFLIKEKGKKRLRVAGCKCNRGIMNKDLLYKVMRQNEPIASDLKINTLKHFKDDVKEVSKGFEFGISFHSEQDFEFKQGDIIMAYEKRKFKPKLKWDLRGFQ